MKILSAKILTGACLCVFLLLSVCCLVYAQDMTEAAEVTVPANAAAQEQQKIQGFHGMFGAGMFVGNSTKEVLVDRKARDAHGKNACTNQTGCSE